MGKMNNQIKISVVVPFYNVEKYLNECLDHLAKQTLKEIEVILVNDGSSDKSRDIALEFINSHKNWYLYEQANQGQSSARNLGIEKARGEYVYFCDSDDILNDSALQYLYEYAKKKNLDILHFEMQSFKEGEPLDLSSNSKVDVNASRLKGYYQVVMSGLECLNIMLKTDIFPSPVIMLIRRELLDEVRFYPGIIHEDVLFVFQLYTYAKQMENIPDCLYHARIRENSTMTTIQYARRFKGFGIGFCEVSDYLLKNAKIVEAYPNLIKAAMFLFSQTIDQYKYLDGRERRQFSELIVKMEAQAKKLNYCNNKRIERFCRFPKIMIWLFMKIHYYFKQKM